MKFLIVVLLLVATVAASFDNVDLSDVRPMEIPGLDPIAEPQDSFIEGRITNGQAATAGQFPYQAGLLLQRTTGNYWCGGSLISVGWVLTAAHCTVDITKVRVTLGTLMSLDTTGATIIWVTASSTTVIVHSEYNATTLANDVSLIKLPQSVTLTAYIQPIQLPKFTGTAPTYAGVSAIASGWGRVTTNSTSISPTLQYTGDQVITNANCAAVFGTLPSSVLCISTPEYKSTCFGDSGGPLAYNNTLIGVTSFVASIGCELGYPAGFSRVTSFLPWIAANSGVVP